MKKLISLVLVILMILSFPACNTKHDSESSVSEATQTKDIYFPGLLIAGDKYEITEDDIDFSLVDYEFYLETVAITLALSRKIENDVYIVTINEYKFEVYVRNNEVIKVFSEKLEN